MAGRLDGKVAIVTGAGSSGAGLGNGKATAILFAREGAKVVCVDQQDERAEETRATIADEHGTASVFVADVTKSSGCTAAVRAAVARYGRLDILHSNVGIVLCVQRVHVVQVEAGQVGTNRTCTGGHEQLVVAKFPYSIRTIVDPDLVARRPDCGRYVVEQQREAGARQFLRGSVRQHARCCSGRSGRFRRTTLDPDQVAAIGVG
ncbi:MAG: SDR family NAD(P)-dependent oxidoreductase [Chloroflexi bacterium]|nr:SDR family NAD(P)-dependent oxidoreductase [Chloroflexota bacterium]